MRKRIQKKIDDPQKAAELLIVVDDVEATLMDLNDDVEAYYGELRKLGENYKSTRAEFQAAIDDFNAKRLDYAKNILGFIFEMKRIAGTEDWKTLAENFLSVKGWSMFDAIQFHPHEATWYGEALLNYGAIPVHPREPLFKAYLYLEEYEADRQIGITTEILARDYLGVVYQSNWYPKRLGMGKNLAYKAKKMIRKIRRVD